MRKGAVGNVGVGIADGIGTGSPGKKVVLMTYSDGRNRSDWRYYLLAGSPFNVNTRAILDMTSQFDFITVVVWMFVI